MMEIWRDVVQIDKTIDLSHVLYSRYIILLLELVPGLSI